MNLEMPIKFQVINNSKLISTGKGTGCTLDMVHMSLLLTVKLHFRFKQRGSSIN